MNKKVDLTKLSVEDLTILLFHYWKIGESGKVSKLEKQAVTVNGLKLYVDPKSFDELL